MVQSRNRRVTTLAITLCTLSLVVTLFTDCARFKRPATEAHAHDRISLDDGIYPSRIDSTFGHWTFLFVRSSAENTHDMHLQIGNERILPYSKTFTTPQTSLWEFRYPSLPQGACVEVLSETSTGFSSASLEVVDSGASKYSAYGAPPPRALIVQVTPGTFDLGRNRGGNLDFANVTCNDPMLRDLLNALNIDTIRKWPVIDILPDTLRAYLEERYTLRFRGDHSSPALLEILRLSPAVLAVELPGIVRSL